jgi:hypothetical protein
MATTAGTKTLEFGQTPGRTMGRYSDATLPRRQSAGRTKYNTDRNKSIRNSVF